MPYWFNVDTGQVETDDNRSQDANVLGPYDSEDAASRALETARPNTEKWDREDREWASGGAWDAGVPGGLTLAQLSRPMREPSAQHHFIWGANLKVPGSGEKAVVSR